MEIIGKDQTRLIAATRKAAPGDQTCITGHYFGGDLDITTEEKLYAILRQIQYGDMYQKGYSDIMYNFFPSPFRPAVILGRGLDNRNAANGTQTGNLVSMSVCLPIGPTLSYLDKIPNGRATLLESCVLADQLIEGHFGKKLPWVGHQTWRPTQCPGEWFMEQILGKFDDRPLPEIPPVWMPDPDYSKRPIVGLGHITWDGFNDYGYVRWVQNFLNRTSPEGCAVDGVWGRQSDDRLRKFQGYFRQQGFPCTVNGITDLNTWATIHWIATQEGIV